MERYNIFENWFAATQRYQTENPGHPEQQNYDHTLMENYRWPFACLPQLGLGGNMSKRLKVYDVGCAYGTVSIGAKLLGYDVTALDLSDTYANKVALDKLGIPFIEFDVDDEDAGWKFEKADIVVFTEVLEHLNRHPQTAMRNLHELLKPGGVLVFSTPRAEDGRHLPGIFQKQGLEHYSELPKHKAKEWVDAHVYIYTSTELHQLMAESNFKIVSTSLAWDGLTYAIRAVAV